MHPHPSIRPLLLASLLAAAACESPQSRDRLEGTPVRRSGPPRFFGDLGAWRRDVTTRSPEAQRWFDQALALTYGFNHDEAIRSYREAARLDPACAMAWWGIAYCNGPHINNPAMDEEHSRAAWEAILKAQALAPRANEVERALIAALAQRYAASPPADRKPLDQAYAAAMRRVWRAHPEDADVGALFAESLMDLHPWDLWTHDGHPKEDTPEIVETLEKVLSMAPAHPGANHFYIHTVEASPNPERGVAAADRLQHLVPGAGHLVHMPGHIYIRVGRLADAAAANERAIEVDRAYRARSPEQGFYRIYMAHNPHFLAFVSMMEGGSERALRAARTMIAEMPREFVEQQALFADAFMPIEMEVMMRFGRWEEILRVPEPPAYLPVTAAYRRFARGCALAATGRPDEAETELAALRESRSKLPEGAIWANNPATNVLAIGEKTLAGEIAARRGDSAAAADALREAVKLEDALVYDEPPDWMQPVRHTLGAVLLRAGRVEEAEHAYREDLARFPENVWSLFGLKRCLEARGGSGEAAEVAARFEKARARADVEIGTTCFCVPGL